MMNRLITCRAKALLWAITITIIALPHAEGQVAVRLTMDKSSYIVNEPVTATISITNRAGRELNLRDENARPWLDFNISSNGRGVPLASRVDYGSAVIAPGQTVARKVTLNDTYALGKMGNYVCEAFVNLPGPTRNGFSSNRVRFTISKGRVTWTQQVGVPGAPNETRGYELITFSGNRSFELFARVSSTNRNQEIATIPLGKIISFRKPTGTLDSMNNMHALYQVSPSMFAHTCVTPDGRRKFTTFHKRGQSSNPRLMAFADGQVRVAGGIPYDPVAEQEQLKKVRNVSERPPFIYN